MAAAQAIVDGRPLSDPAYRGETAWYNPLLPATIAFVSRVSGRPVAETLVQWGPVLNALGPVAFFVMAALLIGPWPALAAVIGLLYSPPYSDPPWVTPSYSPWVFPATFAAALFYAAVLVWTAAFERNSLRQWVLAGCTLGAVFLAHTAPALVIALGGALGGTCAVASRVAAQRRSAGAGALTSLAPYLVRLGLAGGCAALISLPFLWSIAWRYHLHIVNRAPTEWMWMPLASPAAVLRGSIGVRNGIAVLGAATLVDAARRHRGAAAILLWFVSALMLFSYGYLARWVGPDRLPPVLPQFHFFFYMRAAGAIFFGVGAWTLLAASVSVVSRAARVRSAETRRVAAGAALCVLMIFAWIGFHRYRLRDDFDTDRLAARRFTFEESVSRVRDRLRRETPTQAVILATPELSLRLVATAGRAVVAVPAPFSNPYVAFTPRADAQQAMIEAVMARDRERFVPLARASAVSYVLVGPRDLQTVDLSGGVPFLNEVSRRGGYAIFAVR